MNRSVQWVVVVFALCFGAATVAWVMMRPTRGVLRSETERQVTQRLSRDSTPTPLPALRKRDDSTRSKWAPPSPTIPSQPPTSGKMSPAPDRSSLLISARLKCPAGVADCSGNTQARLGLGHVDEADLREVGDSASRTRPATLEDLVNIREWRLANVATSPEGDVVVGPVEVPRVDAYELLAWNNDALVYYHTRIMASEVRESSGTVELGELSPQPYTGVRVVLQGNAEFSHIRAILNRIPAAEAERASRFLLLAQVIAPELMDSLLNAEPIALATEHPNIIAPLPPDEALQITLVSPADIEAQPVQVPLVEGKIVDATISLDDVFPEGARATIELEGRLEIGDTGQPLAGATVLRDLGGRSESCSTDEQGIFRVKDLPMDRISAFDVETTRGTSPRPLVPSRWHFDFAPPLATTGSVVRMKWKVPAYRYLVLELRSKAPQDISALSQPPYPIFVVEREEGGRWQVVPIDFFDVSPVDVAAAIEEPGRYRMLVAASPVAIWQSQPVTITEKSSEVVTHLADPTIEFRELKVRVVDSIRGEGLGRAAVTVSGPNGSLPPVRLLTNDEGVVKFSNQGVSNISLWVEKPRYQPTQRTFSSGELEGEVEIRMAPE